ncbi:2-octaprenyl-6-methoxyphenyl hydroxylase [Alginatibacterium sediminis]|uniref:2-octaprenyl-6-methoxyphenyl hydroxylase n=1 Tax=Alginatibacterium sediminis TaxID=2164068 RepID=A0A420EDG8_9ALTE|nr:2-octaprenyl-6-methoxyphenyl hydroxylase [Alginatibacterium sediminis]RKF18672.1 2-octaprenyl-6-methoxyphenyl hydroxylase [Alginatibacterium sediminis]
MSHQNVDIAIVGGGMVGATLALALSQNLQGFKPIKIALIEAKALDFGAHPGFDSRAIALSAGSKDILEALQLWPSLSALAQPIDKILVSDRGHIGRLKLKPEDYQLDSLGYVIELQQAGQQLHAALAQCDNISLYCPNQIQSLEQAKHSNRLTLEDGQQLTCKLLVAADGGASNLAQQFKLDALDHDFGQSAIIANLRSDQLPAGRAFERFTEHGPIALLPMNDNRWSLVWSVQTGQEQQLLECSDHQFMRSLQSEFGLMAGRFEQVGQRAAYPLKLKHYPRAIAHRCVLIGNSAHTLHPIAGQGFNLGLRSVSVLSQLIQQLLSQETDSDCGSYSLLKRYQDLRSQDTQNTIVLTSLLASSFASADKGAVVARNIGMLTLRSSSFLKNHFANQTLGRFDLMTEGKR